jgi:hypothetical protein
MHLVGHFRNCITIYRFMNVKYVKYNLIKLSNDMPPVLRFEIRKFYQHGLFTLFHVVDKSNAIFQDEFTVPVQYTS